MSTATSRLDFACCGKNRLLKLYQMVRNDEDFHFALPIKDCRSKLNPFFFETNSCFSFWWEDHVTHIILNF